jgi:hypothetical protein
MLSQKSPRPRPKPNRLSWLQVISGQHRDVPPVVPIAPAAALVLAIAAATAVFRFRACILTVPGGSCAAALALRMAGLI